MITKLKSQFTSWLLYNAIEYAYENPDKIKLNILYFSLEESDLDLAGRYSSYLLKKMSAKRSKNLKKAIFERFRSTKA